VRTLNRVIGLLGTGVFLIGVFFFMDGPLVHDGCETSRGYYRKPPKFCPGGLEQHRGEVVVILGVVLIILAAVMMLVREYRTYRYENHAPGAA